VTTDIGRSLALLAGVAMMKLDAIALVAWIEQLTTQWPNRVGQTNRQTDRDRRRVQLM